MEELTYDDFMDELWDYVSMETVSQEFWDDNQAFIRALSFDLYTMYQKSIVKTFDNNVLFNPLSPKIAAKLVEIFFSNFQKFKNVQ